MNWKIWTWPGQIRKAEWAAKEAAKTALDLAGKLDGVRARQELAEASAVKAGEELRRADQEISRLEREVARLRQALKYKDRLDIQPLRAEQVLATLAAVPEENPIWRAALQVVRNQAREETLAAIVPNLSDGGRQYMAGRIAALEDLEGILRQVREQAQTKDAA